ncbi:hypothetical protein MRX96_037851 [Rhipicephalus microplus]
MGSASPLHQVKEHDAAQVPIQIQVLAENLETTSLEVNVQKQTHGQARAEIYLQEKDARLDGEAERRTKGARQGGLARYSGHWQLGKAEL